MRHAELVFNLTGQSFTYDPPEMFRASGTPEVSVFSSNTDDNGTAQVATTGSASVDSVNTTLGAAASAGDQTLTVASGTGITRGRRYLLKAADGSGEWVDCVSITGTTVGLRHPIVGDYAITTSTFQGTRISISVLDAWIQDSNNITDVLGYNWRTTEPNDAPWAPGAAGYRLRWSYTVNSKAELGVSYADVVRYQAKNLVSALDVDRRFPGWIDRLATDYHEDQGAALVEEAFHAVKMDALTDAQLVRRIRDTQVLSELVIYRANMLAVQANLMAGSGTPDTLRIAQDLYDARYNMLIREPKVAVDQTGGGSNGEAVRLHVFRR